MLTFSLEGIIGCGKSTTLNILKERGFTVIPEPLEEYSKFGEFNPLACAYACPMKESPLAQLHIMRCAGKHYPAQLVHVLGVPPIPLKFVFSERSFFSSEIFINAYHEVGNLSAFSRSFLLGDHKTMSANQIKPDAYIFLDLHPDICCKRVAERGVSCEKEITPELQWALRDAHHGFFSKERSEFPFVRTVYVRIEASDTPEQVADNILKELTNQFGTGAEEVVHTGFEENAYNM